MDWPIDHKEMDKWYTRAENHMGTLGTGGRERLPGNNNYKVFEAGAKKLGYKNFHTGNMSINSKPYDGRVACQQIGSAFKAVNQVQMVRWLCFYSKGEATGNLNVERTLKL